MRVIALGPGYEAGRHCHFVIETMRGPNLGAVIERGCAAPHTGVPGDVLGLTEKRLLRSPADGPVVRLMEIGDFVEIYTRSPLEACMERDVKGMYKRALAGEIKEFTGVDDPYEEPENPELVIDTDKETVEESAVKVLVKLQELGYLD